MNDLGKVLYQKNYSLVIRLNDSRKAFQYLCWEKILCNKNKMNALISSHISYIFVVNRQRLQWGSLHQDLSKTPCKCSYFFTKSLASANGLGNYHCKTCCTPKNPLNLLSFAPSLPFPFSKEHSVLLAGQSSLENLAIHNLKPTTMH